MDYLNLYVNFLKKFLKFSRQAKSLKVVFDCSNGTVGLVIKKLRNLEIKKLEMILINEKPDGNFPAHGPNPMVEGALNDLRLAIRRYSADLGVIFDADGDRVFFLDSYGRLITVDVVIALISKNYQGPVIADLRIGYLGRDLISADGKKIIDSRVGHYFIKKLMKKKKVNFAGELSGHYYFYFPEYDYYADSGIFAAIQFINTVSKLKSDLSSWIDSLPKYYSSGELNFAVEDKQGVIKKVENFYKKSAKEISYLDGIMIKFDNWWFNLRPSNTENLLRLNLESKIKLDFDKNLKILKNLIKN